MSPEDRHGLGAIIPRSSDRAGWPRQIDDDVRFMHRELYDHPLNQHPDGIERCDE
jgi:hypothetical protein